jgi:proton-translocating NADH-quinone oxidoreductase chain L
MPQPAFLLLVATLLPLISFCVLLGVGRRIGNPVAGWFGTLAMSVSFFCSLLAMFSWYRGSNMPVPGPTGPVMVRWGFHDSYDKGPIDLPVKWLPAGLAGRGLFNGDRAGWLDLGLYIDSLTIAMFAMITLVALLVHWFSISYMRTDPRFSRFFAYLGLFSFSMLALTIAGSLLQLFIFWELVGLCSYLLIGFWYEKKTASNAAIKAFIVNRIGDVGLLVGFGLLFYYLGNVTLPRLWLALGGAGAGGPIALSDGTVLSPTMLTAIGICLFCGAVGKSAQFPLHVWLPDAMEGPTPVSALIHAATMVAAGVYMLGRVYPVLTPAAKLFIAIVGLITLTLGALVALVQSDIKRVLAWSTVSQLGYMVLAMGVGSWTGGLFHLLTHAFFKALLFLGAGSVIVAARHEQELPQFGGLMKRMPLTAITFGIGVLAISGTTWLSGHYSKDMILRHAGAFATLATTPYPASAGTEASGGLSHWYWLFFVVPTAVAYLTAFYMTRCWMLTFWGKPRNLKLFARAQESPGLWGPLLILAVMSFVAGSFLSIPELLQSSMRESQVICRRQAAQDTTGFYRNQRFALFATAWPGPLPGDAGVPENQKAESDADDQTTAAVSVELTASQKAHAAGDSLVGRYLTWWSWLVGITLGIACYWSGYTVAERALQFLPLARIRTWLYHGMYFDELYYSVVVATMLAVSRLSAWFDRCVVDNVVNLTGWLVRQAAFGAGANDRYVIDGAVNGIGRLAQDLGAAVRAPQTGRIRMYVTILALAIAIGAAVAVIVVATR